MKPFTTRGTRVADNLYTIARGEYSTPTRTAMPGSTTCSGGKRRTYLKITVKNTQPVGRSSCLRAGYGGQSYSKGLRTRTARQLGCTSGDTRCTLSERLNGMVSKHNRFPLSTRKQQNATSIRTERFDIKLLRILRVVSRIGMPST